MTYTPTAGYKGDDSFTYTVTSGGVTETASVAVTVVPKNLPPVFAPDDSGPSAPLAYGENDPASVIAPDAQLSDPDSLDFDTGILTVKFDANGEASDQLGIRNQGTADGQIGVSGTNVTYSNIIIGTFTGGSNGSPLVITFDPDATPAAVQALVRNITYHSISNNPATSKTVNFTVTDGDGGSAQANAAVNITLANDAPTLIDTSVALTAQAEDAPAPGVGAGTLVSSLVDLNPPNGGQDNVTDPDGSAVTGIALTGVDMSQGSWLYSLDGGTSWTAVGTVSNGSALLLAADANTRLYFQPSANFNGTISRAITFRAWDQTSGSAGSKVDTASGGGTTAFSSATDTASLTATAVNDAPVVANPIADHHSNEDAAVSYQVPSNAFSDIDSASLTYSAALANGDALPSWLSFDASTRTFSGAPPQNVNGTIALRVTASDGSLSASDTFDLVIDPVNDAPSAANGMVLGSEDDPYVFTANDFGFSDPADGHGLAAVIVDSLPMKGTLKLTRQCSVGGPVHLGR